MRRVLVAVGLIAGLVLVTTPALAADTYHWRNSGNGLFAYSSNIPWDSETWPAGTYYETYVDASTYVFDGETYSNGVCVSYWSFTIDRRGRWTDGPGYGGCAEATTLDVDRRLGGAMVTATIPVEDCTAWDRKTGACVGEWIVVATFEVDLQLTGSGPLYRRHGTSTGGIAGLYQFSYHGTGTERAAIASGWVTFDGASIFDVGAPGTGASLWSVQEGGVDVMVCNPRTGC